MASFGLDVGKAFGNVPIVDERPFYRLRPQDPSAAQALGDACGLGRAAAQVLIQRGLAEPTDARAFLEPRLSGLSSPATMVDRDAAADRLAKACQAGERIVVFGDYDVDGGTSCAILSDLLELFGAQVRSQVANRFEGGYGFSEPALNKALAFEPSVIVTCDCGSSDHPRVRAATEAGIDVIVVDHHLVPEEPLPALAFLNPHRPDCGFAYKGMCSAGLAFSLGAAIRSRLGLKLDLRPWLDLVALGTIADVAPLDGDNRALTRAGLRLITSDRARPGVQALRELTGIRPGSRIGAHEVAFRFAPRLNAPGRLGDPTVTVALLRSKTIEEARRHAARIEELNNERKGIQNQMSEEAYAQVEALYGGAPTHGVVLASEDWHRGVVGITAARVVDRYGVPAVVIASDGTHGHGSARTPEGFHLYNALQKCSDLLVRFGGHAAAAGATLSMENIEAFRTRFAENAPAPDAATRLPMVDVELGPEFDLPTVEDIMRLEPLGEANAQPTYAIRDAKIEDLRAVGDGQHLKLRLRVGRRFVSAFGPGMAHEMEGLGKHVTVVGHLRPDFWRGGDNLELSVSALRPAG